MVESYVLVRMNEVEFAKIIWSGSKMKRMIGIIG